MRLAKNDGVQHVVCTVACGSINLTMCYAIYLPSPIRRFPPRPT